MKLQQINYHMERAAHFRLVAQWDGSGAPGQIDPGVTTMYPEKALARVLYHENRAQELLLEGARAHAAKKARKAQKRGRTKKSKK